MGGWGSGRGLPGKYSTSDMRSLDLRRLGWGADIANPDGGKPKGMHWRTFERLRAAHDAYANTSWAGMAQQFEVLNRRLGRVGLDLDDRNLDD